jgi:hypothetical protein
MSKGSSKKRELTEAEVLVQLADLDRQRTQLLAKKACFEKARVDAKAESLLNVPRKLETLCELYRAGKIEKATISKLIDHLWATSGPDYVSFRGKRLMDAIDNELEDVDDSFGIIFLDLNAGVLHTIAYRDDNDYEIAKWSGKTHAIVVYAK